MPTPWSFYGRAEQVGQIDAILARGHWFMCSLQGRRRIGKSELLRHVLASKPGLRSIWCQLPDGQEAHAVAALKAALAVSEDANVAARAPAVTDFASFARVVADLCRDGFVVVLDEFQFLCRPALHPLASFLQEQVDRLRNTLTGGLFVLGSLQTEMEAVLADRNAPLFGRRTHSIELTHWDFADLVQLYRAQGVESPSQWLTLWSLFEGVPKYYKDAHDYGVLEMPTEGFLDAALARMFLDKGSAVRVEADTWLLKELKGRNLAIVDFIARNPGKYSGDIVAGVAAQGENLRVNLGHLVDRFKVVTHLQPIFAGTGSRSSRYYLADNFTQAWFAFGKPLVGLGELAAPDRALAQVRPTVFVHEGYSFEKLVRGLHAECSRKSVDFPLDVLSGFWNKARLVERSIELDLVAVDRERRHVRFGSCKRSAAIHAGTLGDFEKHIHAFLLTLEGKPLRDYQIERMLFAPEFKPDERAALEAKGTYRCRDLRDYAAMF